MNYEQFVAEELVVEQTHLKEVLRCLLNTVIFQRALNPIKASEVDCEFFSITYARVESVEILKEIEEKIEQFSSMVKKAFESTAGSKPQKGAPGAAATAPGGPTTATTNAKKSQVILSFYEKRIKKTFFGKSEDKVNWERWVFPITVIQVLPGGTSERLYSKVTLEQNLKSQVLFIIKTADEKKDHIPPVNTSDKVCFPFEITTSSESSESWGTGLFKWALKSNPTML